MKTKILSALVLLVLALSFGGLVFAVEENPSMGTGNPPKDLPSQPINFPAQPATGNPQSSGGSQSIEIPNPLKLKSIIPVKAFLIKFFIFLL